LNRLFCLRWSDSRCRHFDIDVDVDIDVGVGVQ
jgi:hypothetical protein